jgi:hypothetical protein
MRKAKGKREDWRAGKVGDWQAARGGIFRRDGWNFRLDEASKGWRSPRTLGREGGLKKKIRERRFAMMVVGGRETMVRVFRPDPAIPGQQYYEIFRDAAKFSQTPPSVLRE